MFWRLRKLGCGIAGEVGEVDMILVGSSNKMVSCAASHVRQDLSQYTRGKSRRNAHGAAGFPVLRRAGCMSHGRPQRLSGGAQALPAHDPRHRDCPLSVVGGREWVGSLPELRSMM